MIGYLRTMDNQPGDGLRSGDRFFRGVIDNFPSDLLCGMLRALVATWRKEFPPEEATKDVMAVLEACANRIEYLGGALEAHNRCLHSPAAADERPAQAASGRIVAGKSAACACGWKRPLISITTPSGAAPAEDLIPAYLCPQCEAGYVPVEIDQQTALRILRDLYRLSVGP